MEDRIFISGNTPSSKNSQQWTGEYLVSSRATQRWRRKSKNEWIANRLIFIKMLEGLEPPYYIELEFHRMAKRKFDYINAAQAVQDAMVTYQWLEDDNADIMKPYFADYVHNKINPGVYIKVLKTKPEHESNVQIPH